MDDTAVSRKQLADFFCKSVGEEKASELVNRALADMGVTTYAFPRETGLAVLKAIGETSGLIGIVARCASAKLVIKAR